MEVDPQEPTAPEGAPSASSREPVAQEPVAQEPVAAPDGSATPETEPEPAAEAGAAEQAPAAEAEAPEEPPAAEPVAEAAPAAPAADWSHLRGLQAIEPPAAAWAERADYAEELAKEMAARAARFVRSVDDSIVLSSDGVLRWLGDPVARLIGGETPLTPRTVLLADETLTPEDREAAHNRANLWIAAHVRKILGPLVALADGAELPEDARALGAKIAEAYGVLERERVRNEVRGLDQTTRGAFRKLGVRFGSLFIYVPALLKPAPRALCVQLWTLRRGADTGADRLLAFASAGRTSFANDGMVSPDAYRVAGFRLCGERVVRIDILERLSDLIRAASPDHLRGGSRGASETQGFLVTPQMTSLTGCSGEAFASILRSLGYETAKVSKAAFEAARRPAPTQPITPAAPAVEAEGAGEPAEGSEISREGEAAQEASQSEGPTGDVVEAAPPAEADAAGGEATEASAPVEAADHATAPVAEPEPAVDVASRDAADEVTEPAGATEATPEETGDAAQVEAVEAAAVDAAEAAPVEAVEAAAGDEEIEVWRLAPRRPRAPPRPPRAERAERSHAPGPHRRSGAPRPPEPASADAAPVEPPRHEKRHEEPPRRFEGKGDKRGRDERRPPPPPRRESRPADPDSPFAKLAALKPLLEQRDKRN